MPEATVVVLTSLASEEAAVPFVRTLLDLRLVACATILPPARSFYHWEGHITEEREVVILLKTRRERLEALTEVFERLHPYDIPEMLTLPVQGGLPSYLGWIAAEASGVEEPPT
jgi:periplasmic divalent cation tolerance protein